MEKIVCFLLLALYGISAAPVDDNLIDDNLLVNNTIVARYMVAREAQFPFMVSIQRRFETLYSNKHKCGGALITLQHVLTAASCLYDTLPGYPVLINVEHFRVFAGAVNLGNDNDVNRVRFISNFTIHPDFMNNNQHANDIAILTLDTPFIASNRIAPLALPEPNSITEVTSRCEIPGWGKTHTGGSNSLDLKYAPKLLLNQTECETQYTTMFDYPATVTPSMVCGVGDGSWTYGCSGDEGNPLVCNQRKDLVGIMFHSNRCGISTDPVLYTRVSNYTVWAQSVAGIPVNGSASFQSATALVFIISIAQIITSMFKH